MLTLMKGSLLLHKCLCSPELPSLVAKQDAQALDINSEYGGSALWTAFLIKILQK